MSSALKEGPVEILLDPNVAYVLLVVGAFLGLLAIIAPGTGMLEVASGFCLLLSAYALTRLQFNWWALVLLGLSLIPFGLTFLWRRRGLLLGLTILGMTIGSVFLFREPSGGPGVNPVLAAIVSLAFSVLVWTMASRGLEAQHALPTNNPDSVVGEPGQARTAVNSAGSVQVASELWSARSEKAIPEGSPVRVVSRDGFVLIVEPLSKSS